MSKAIRTIFLSSRFLFFLFGVISLSLVPLKEGYLGSQIDSGLPSFISMWANFDGRHFLTIALSGYQRFDYVFFPLYPLLISLFSKFTALSPLLWGIILSLIFYFLLLVVFAKLITLDYKKPIVHLSLLAISVFPTAFFFQAVYSESLFVLCSIASFYCARQKRWFLAGLFAGLASATRITGFALLPSLLIEWLIVNRKDLSAKKYSGLLTEALPMALLSVSGIIIYMIYLYFYRGDPFIFIKSFSAWDRSHLVLFPQVIYRYIKIFITVDKTALVYWVAVLEFLTIILFSILTVFTAIKVRLSYAVFMALIFLLGSLSGSFIGSPRYAIQAFPGFIAIAMYLSEHSKMRIPAFLLSILLGFILTALYFNGYFVS